MMTMYTDSQSRKRGPRHESVLFFLLGILMVTGIGCGYYLVPQHFQPFKVAEQQSPDEDTSMDVLDDGTVTFFKNRLEVSVRPMQDEELNRALPEMSAASPSDPLPSNPFTYGEWEDPRTGRPPQRFSVFLVTVKNYEFPKVKLDPMKIVMESTNGREYFPWGFHDFEEMFPPPCPGLQRAGLSALHRT